MVNIFLLHLLLLETALLFPFPSLSYGASCSRNAHKANWSGFVRGQEDLSHVLLWDPVFQGRLGEASSNVPLLIFPL